MNDDEVKAVVVKLPTFWSKQPEIWFAQAEAQFTLRNITDDTAKYHNVVAALDQQTAVRILDIIKVPPAADAFKTIKDRLLSTYTLTEYQRANKLLDLPGLGDEPPSALMDNMLAINGDHPPCYLFRHIFLRQLPEDIRVPLVHGKVEDCRELAKAADLLWQARSSTMSEVRSSTPQVVTKKKTKATWIQAPGGPCYYHSTYGKDAHRCRTPCSESENAPAGRQ